MATYMALLWESPTAGEGLSLEPDSGGVRVTDGPFGESKEVIGGYFLLEADSEQAAVDLLRDCPHLAFGGRIDLRAVAPT